MAPIPPISFERVTQDLTFLKRFTVTDDLLDAMGHMNVRHYLGFFDTAAWDFFASFGMTAEYYVEYNAGAFALEHHIRYLAEVRLGETVAIYARMLDRTAKRVHFIYFMANETTQAVAATLEGVGSHADLTIRRTSPFEPHIAANIDAILREHQALTWLSPVCGVMGA